MAAMNNVKPFPAASRVDAALAENPAPAGLGIRS